MRKLSLISILAMLAFSPAALAQATATGGTTMSVNIGAEATINITQSTTSLIESGTNFTAFAGTTNFTYQVRTSQGNGTGTVALKVTSDFNCALGGPCIASSPTSGDFLTFTCTGSSGASTPTPCSSPQTASTTSSTTVLTFPKDAHSNAAPGDTGSVIWSLVNDPKYKTGTYTSTVTFTISAA